MRVPAPLPGMVKDIVYPQIPQGVLPNGLRVLVVPDDHLPRISVKLVFPGGRVCNPDQNLSLVQLAVELLDKGTATRSASEISSFLDQWAMELDKEVVMEHSLLVLTVLENYLEPALELLSDLVLNPTFPEEELDKLKTRWKSDLIAERSQPGFLAEERVFQALYPGHPYSKVSIPIEHLEKTERRAVRAIHALLFVPGSALLLFAGPIDLSRATHLASRFFGTWRAKLTTPVEYPQLPSIEKRLVCLVHRPNSVQSEVLVAVRTLSKTHPLAIPLKVMNQVLGGGASARLFLNLREEKGYTYGAYSFLKTYLHDGVLLADASVRTEATLDSIQEIFKEIEGLRQTSPGQEELTRCQAELTGALIRQMETPASVGGLELFRRLYRLPADYHQKFIPAVRSVTDKTILDTARRFLDPNHFVVSVVADRNQVENALQQLGELRVYDTWGNPL